jgi:hypothetical protein
MAGRGQITPKWKKGESGNPNGRPKKSLLVKNVNELLKSEGYEPVTNNDLIDCQKMLLNIPYNKLQEIAINTNNEFPTLYQIFAKALLSDDSAELIEKLLDRAYGKAKQTIENTGTQVIINRVQPNASNEPII